MGKTAWMDARALGVFDGSMPGAPLTREQFAVTLEKSWKMPQADGDAKIE